MSEMINIKEEPSGNYYNWKLTGKPERPWLLPYHRTLVSKFLLCIKDPEGGAKKVLLTFEDALETARKLDNITLGIPKIVYLVGWQFEGHDSKYPSFAQVNKRLKRDEDKTAEDSLRWLFQEGKKINTIFSLHINMFDAYEDSPLWEKYNAADIFAKDKKGRVIFGEIFEGQRSTQISYAREWELGFTRKRIDDLLTRFPELIDAKTIHIDAFHSARPLDKKSPISPFLNYSTEKEVAAQRKIYRYFRNKGIDVTSEGAGFLRPDPFIGLQPFAWANEKCVRELPNELYCSTPMRAEPEILADPLNLSGLIEQFCTQVLPWYLESSGTKQEKECVVIKKGFILHPLSWTQLFTLYPVPWKKEPTLVAFSKTKKQYFTIPLPKSWIKCSRVNISYITLSGLKKDSEINVDNGNITLEIEKNQGVVIAWKEQ